MSRTKQIQHIMAGKLTLRHKDTMQLKQLGYFEKTTPAQYEDEDSPHGIYLFFGSYANVTSNSIGIHQDEFVWSYGTNMPLDLYDVTGMYWTLAISSVSIRMHIRPVRTEMGEFNY